jgi:hypothetical protein
VFAWDELRRSTPGNRFSALDLVWYEPKGEDPAEARWPLKKMFAGVNVAFLRSDWRSPEATWIGIKGGNNHANHSHLDLGSFVLDAHGQRWAIDLGSDEYNMPGYFGKERFTYYRLKTESHNTVLIDGANQDPMAKAPLTLENGAVVVDLSAAYPGKVTRLVRTVELLPDNSIRMRDELEAPQPVDARWGMVTDAQVKLDGTRARLQKAGAALELEIVSPKGAVFETVPTTPPQAMEDPNRGTQKLVVRLNGKVTNTRIEVLFR